MRKARWWLLGAFSIVLTMALTVIGLVGWHPLHYRLFHDEASLHVILRETVRNGDRMEDVERLLGPCTELRGSIRATLARAHARFPEGFEPSDILVSYRISNGEGQVLQFRRGRLVNFSPYLYR